MCDFPARHVWGHRVKHPFGVWESDNSDGFEPHFGENSWTLVANGSFTFATGQSAHHWRRMGVEFGQLAHQTQRLVREVSPWCLDCCPCGAPAFWGSGCDDFALDEPNLFCSKIKSPKFKVFQSFSFDQFPLFSFIQAHWKRLYIYIYLFHFPLSFYCWTPLQTRSVAGSRAAASGREGSAGPPRRHHSSVWTQRLRRLERPDHGVWCLRGRRFVGDLPAVQRCWGMWPGCGIYLLGSGWKACSQPQNKWREHLGVLWQPPKLQVKHRDLPWKFVNCHLCNMSTKLAGSWTDGANLELRQRCLWACSGVCSRCWEIAWSRCWCLVAASRINSNLVQASLGSPWVTSLGRQISVRLFLESLTALAETWSSSPDFRRFWSVPSLNTHGHLCNK